MKKGLVRHWMTEEVITVAPSLHLNDAKKVMNVEKIRSLVVLDEEKLVGILTLRGLLRSDLSPLFSPDAVEMMKLKNETVGRIMTTNVITIKPESPLPKAARVMMENKITALPVAENGHGVDGIITSSDLFRFILAEVPGLMEDLRVKRYASDELVVIPSYTSLLEAHRLMGVKRIRTLPVVDDGKLVGIVTRTDLMSADPSRFSKAQHDIALSIGSEKVERIMSRNLVIINEDAPITEAAQKMLDNKIHCLPVIGQDGELLGIITESDLFRLIVQKFF